MYEWSQVHPGVFLFRDPLCNVYLLQDSYFGLLIEAGSGAVFDRLSEIGVSRVDMVLLTHHHRDVAAGVYRAGHATVMVPQGESRFITDAKQFWKSWKIYVRYDLTNATNTLVTPREAESLSPGRVIDWRNWSIECIHLPGHTPHSFGYSARWGDLSPVMFTGDILTSEAGTTHTVHDLHWDYMPPPAGIRPALEGTIPAIRKRSPTKLLPSHGEPVTDVKTALDNLEKNLSSLEEHLKPNRKPREDNSPREILPHLIFLGNTTYLIVSNSGKGFVYDWGYMDVNVLKEAKSKWGCEEIEVVSFSHYHEDHVARLNELFYSSETSFWRHPPEIWVHNILEDVLRNPTAYNLPCLWPVPIRPDLVVGDGERVKWHEYTVEFFHMPGQTFFHQGMVVDIDGKRCLFSGDNLWRPGEEARLPRGPLIPRNVYLPEHGFPYVSEMLEKFDPDLIVPSHYEPFAVTDEYLDAFKKWADGIAPALQTVTGKDRLNLAVNPHWVTTYPYRAEVKPLERLTIEMRIKNPFMTKTTFRLALLKDAEWKEALLDGPPGSAPKLTLAPGEEAVVPFVLKNGDTPGREVLLAEVWVNGSPMGAPAEAILDTL